MLSRGFRRGLKEEGEASGKSREVWPAEKGFPPARGREPSRELVATPLEAVPFRFGK